MAFFPKKQNGPSELAWDVSRVTLGSLESSLKSLTDRAYRVFAIWPEASHVTATDSTVIVVSYVNVAYAKKLAKQKKKKPVKRAKPIAEDAEPLGGG